MATDSLRSRETVEASILSEVIAELEQLAGRLRRTAVVEADGPRPRVDGLLRGHVRDGRAAEVIDHVLDEYKGLILDFLMRFCFG